MPPKTRQPVIIDGANELSLRGFIWVVRHWKTLRVEMETSEGYLWHHVYFQLPFTLGLISFWQDKRSANRFAQMLVHTKFAKWAEQNPNMARGGWLATYEYKRGGALWGTGVTKVKRRFEEAMKPLDDKGDE
jgi:hypothetical protein